MSEELRETGRNIMREALGEAYFERREASTNSFNAPLRRFSKEACFGTIWSGPVCPARCAACCASPC